MAEARCPAVIAPSDTRRYVPYPVESTNNLRHNYLFADADLSKAVQHAVTMGREGQCRVPKPRLIQVKDVYPHPSKTYIPHCTILHQCGDDAGCCKSDTLTCTARKAEQVELYFYVSCCKMCSEICCSSTPVAVYYRYIDLLFIVFLCSRWDLRSSVRSKYDCA